MCLDLLLHTPEYLWNQKLEVPSILDFRMNISDLYMNFFPMSLKSKKIFMMYFYRYLYYYWNDFLRVVFWTKKISFWGEIYLNSLNDRIFVEKFWKSILYEYFKTNIKIYTNCMNRNSKSFYPRNMFEFIHHQKYRCRHY